MRNIIKTGLCMLLLAIVLIGLSAVVMRAHAASVSLVISASSASSAASVTLSAANSEVRPVDASIVNIVMNGPIDLVLKQAAVPELMVHGEPNMLSRVTTRIEGNTLYIGTRGMFIVIRQPLRIEMALPALEKLQMQGSGDAMIKGFHGRQFETILRGSGNLQFEGDYQQVLANAVGSGDVNLVLPNSDNIELTAMGSGNINLKGQTKLLTAKMSGSGNLDAVALRANLAVLNASGSSDAKITATQEVKVRLSGSGDARIYGNPTKRTVQSSGSGEVNWQ